MKKIMEKSKKFLTLILIAAIAFITTTTSSDAVTDTIQIGDAEDLPAYVGGVQFATKTTTSGDFLYCLEMEKKTPMFTTAKLGDERDSGIAAIILNGYPNKSFTGDYKKDYYITQTAIWWYLDETTGSTNLGEQFKSEGSDEYGLRTYIQNLVNIGLEGNKNGYKTISVSMNSDDDKLTLNGDYYTSETVNVTTSETTYTVSLEGATAGTKVVGATSNEEKTTFASTEGFIIKVPASEASSNLNIKVTVTVSGQVYKAYEYVPEDSTMQTVTPGKIEPTTENVSTSINLGLTPVTPDEPEPSKVTVTKYDSTTDKILPGAKLVIKDSTGKIVESWTSTNTSYVVTGLENGSYTVSEEEAPTGYELSNEVVNFTISEDADIVDVKFYNTPKEDTVVNITKIDSETGSALAGATLVIKDANGNEVDRFVSTNESHVITGLEYGTYTLSEVSAPNGYKTSDEVMTFTLDDDHISYQIEYANYKEIVVPNTSTSSILYVILGIAIIGTGLGFVYKNAKSVK